MQFHFAHLGNASNLTGVVRSRGHMRRMHQAFSHWWFLLSSQPVRQGLALLGHRLFGGAKREIRGEWLSSYVLN